MKSYKVTNLFTTLWGLVGLWIILGGLFLSLQGRRSVIGAIFFSTASLVVIYVLITGKTRMKQEYTTGELILRGILMISILIIVGVMAYFIGSMRPYLIVYMAVMIVLLSLIGFQLVKATREDG